MSFNYKVTTLFSEIGKLPRGFFRQHGPNMHTERLDPKDHGENRMVSYSFKDEETAILFRLYCTCVVDEPVTKK